MHHPSFRIEFLHFVIDERHAVNQILNDPLLLLLQEITMTMTMMISPPYSPPPFPSSSMTELIK